MQDAPPAVQDMFRKLWQEIEQQNLERETRAAAADPLAHKLSRVMAGPHGLSYRYVPAGRDGRGRQVSFCWSVHRNVAGFYLGWREVVSRKQTRRDQWLARRIRRRVMAIAERRAAAFRRRHAPPAPPA